MIPIPASASPPFDFWEYFDAIPPVDFRGHDCADGVVDSVWQTSGGRYQHVLIRSKEKNVSMVLVLIVPDQTVYGHFLLDLNRAYGVEG